MNVDDKCQILARPVQIVVLTSSNRFMILFRMKKRRLMMQMLIIYLEHIDGSVCVSPYYV